jgi:tetratricopeptide (TPR) repeat protein
VEALQRSLPSVAQPLNTLRVFADGHCVIVKDEAGDYEPTTGQLVLNFGVGSLRDDVVRVLRKDTLSRDLRAAYASYLEGCRLDQDEETYEEAEAAYRRALELDPSMSTAYTNLGNLFFRRGEMDMAEKMYIRAIKIDEGQPEALYNLGFLYHDQGDLARALIHFEKATQIDPAFADAHFNLAMVMEALDRSQDARVHWETYLALDPDSNWADIARTHLDVEPA